jgi:hypothetical protein
MTLLDLGQQANRLCEARHGDRVSYGPIECVRVDCAPEAIEDVLSSVPPVRAVAITVNAARAGQAEIRAIALARILLPETEHIVALWDVLTPSVAQVALRFGANHLAGIPPGTPRAEIERLIRDAGREPVPAGPQPEAEPLTVLPGA